MEVISSKERWLPIFNFDGYEVSDQGRVRSWRVQRSGKLQASNPRLLRQASNGLGYMLVCLRRENQNFNSYVHRLILEAFVGPRPEGMEACHNDGDKTNNHWNNLRWDTHKNNLADRKLHGTDSAGSKHGQSKLTEPEVLQIRALYKAGGIAQKELGKQFGVTPAVISRIINRKNWNHV